MAQLFFKETVRKRAKIFFVAKEMYVPDHVFYMTAPFFVHIRVSSIKLLEPCAVKRRSFSPLLIYDINLVV